MTIRMMMTILIACFITMQAQARQPSLELGYPNLKFNLAVDLQNASDGSDRIFVVEQAGLIKVYPNEANVAAADVFLDIRDRVLSDSRFGLLGMTFHPNFSSNGAFYVHYTAAGPNRSVIARYLVDEANLQQAVKSSELVLLEVNQPHNFHNGGQLAFGPDGYLYIGFGDGGPVGGSPDPNGEGQNRQTLLGSFVRIDVNNPSGNTNYSIPSDNPFVGNTSGFREEIWAWGFRNPWRFSFDSETGMLWTGENGENSWEEINVVEKGKNYGWKIMEASRCFSPASGCNTAGLELPVWEYGGTAQRRSVIGGYVYRGANHPELYGKYVYGDWLLGTIWALDISDPAAPTNTVLASNFSGIGTFGVDEAGELLVSNLSDGQIYRFASTATSVAEAVSPPEIFYLQQNYPNPFNPITEIRYQLREAGFVTLEIYNLRGKIIRQLVTEWQAPGLRTVRWNGRTEAGEVAASGIYIYRLRVGDIEQSRRMLLLK